MTFGGDKKKVIGYLAVLVPLAGYSIYTNVLSGPDTPASSSSGSQSRTAPATSLPGAATMVSPGPKTTARTASSRSREEFRPAFRSKRQQNEAAIDPARIDPTLRLDLLAKVQGVDLAGGARNVFQFGAPPAPKVEPIKGPEPKVVRFVGPVKPPDPPPPAAPPPPPPPPPIPLKFYGYSTASDTGRKTAYLLHNDDIIQASEGQTVERRYRVIRINTTSIVMEDTEAKRQQTLPLVEDAQGAG